MADIPEWWERLTPEGRETYLRTHPNSSMAKIMNDQAKEHVSANSKDRVKLRSTIKKIGANPKKVLQKDFEKFDKVKPGRYTKKKEEELHTALRQAKRGKLKAMAKAVGIALAVAGVATIGGAALATGGLPYIIITARLVKDMRDVSQQVHAKIKDGMPALQATLTSVKDTVSKSLSDPKVVAAALVLSQNKREKQAQKVHSPTKKDDDRPAKKTQGVTPKQEKKKKHDSNQITELAPKRKSKLKSKGK